MGTGVHSEYTREAYLCPWGGVNWCSSTIEIKEPCALTKMPPQDAPSMWLLGMSVHYFFCPDSLLLCSLGIESIYEVSEVLKWSGRGLECCQ